MLLKFLWPSQLSGEGCARAKPISEHSLRMNVEGILRKSCCIGTEGELGVFQFREIGSQVVIERTVG